MSKEIFGTKEWANDNYNIISGCSHDCKYCYSKEMAIRFKRKNSNNWKIEEINQKKILEKAKKRNGTIMYPSSHDITPKYFEEHRNTILKLLKAGNNLLLVSKPHRNLVKKLVFDLKDYKDKVVFRFSIGSLNDDTLKFWEPMAPSITERIESLEIAFKAGFKTSVSCEPVLDAETKNLVNAIYPFINDSIWIGKPNFLLRRLKVNGYKENSQTYKKGEILLSKLNDEYFIYLEKRLEKYELVKWKESVKKILGKELLQEEGADI